MTGPRIVVAPDPDRAAAEACRLVLAAERRALAERGAFAVALAGGSTPRRLYERLAGERADFRRWLVFFGDERWVPPGHPDSNARMAREALLDRVAIPRHQVCAVDTNAGSPAKAAELYSRALRRRLPGAPPVLDLVLLGLGADGHTASLFPGSAALEAPGGLVAVANRAPSGSAWRVTLTFGTINAAREVLFLASGRDKAEAFARVARRDDALPASRVRPVRGTLTFVVDEDAASQLDPDVARDSVAC